MADANTLVQLGENSPEHVALKLVEMVAKLERRELVNNERASNPANRKWLLDTYCECLTAVKGFRYQGAGPSDTESAVRSNGSTAWSPSGSRPSP
jgi:hypothetical protein